MAITPENWMKNLDPGTTGAAGSDGGRAEQFGNLLATLAHSEAENLATGAPGSTPHPDRAGDPGHGDVSVTDPFGHLNGSTAPPLTGTTATSWEGMESLWGSANPHSTGAGQGSVTNGSQRITHRG